MEWSIQSDGDSRDAAALSGGLAVDPAGYSVIASTVEDTDGKDVLITRRDPDGNLLWNVRFNHPDGGNDVAASVVTGSDGDPIVRIYNSSNSIAKFRASDGLLLWRRDLVSANGSIAVGADGAVYVGGTTARKLRIEDGAQIWESALGSDYGILVAAHGDPILYGTATGPSSLSEMTAIRLDAVSGLVVWRAQAVHPAGFGSTGLAAASAPNGSVALAGHSPFSNGGDYWVGYFSASGDLIWARSYDGPVGGNDVANAVVVDASGDVIVSGESAGSNIAPFRDYATIKWRGSDGMHLWSARYGGTGDDRALAVSAAANGDVLVGGETNPFGNGTDVVTVRYSGATGTLQWGQPLAGSAQQGDYFGGLRIDAQDRVFLSARLANASTDHVVARYVGTSGALLWSANEGPGLSRQSICGLPSRLHAVDPGGNSVILGCTFDGSSDDLLVQKIGPRGQLLWSRSIDAGDRSDDEPRALAVSADGDIVVAATTGRSSGNMDMFVSKLAGIDGNSRWQMRLDDGNYDDATAVALDSAGDLVLAGSSNGPNGGSLDMLARKLSGANGALLWSMRYDGLLSLDDEATGLLALNGGDFLLLGVSEGRITTMRLAGADGANRWLRTHGVNFHNLYAESMKLDDQGQVLIAANGAGLSLLKYRVADGSVVWTRDDMTFFTSRPPSLELDTDNNIFVAGGGPNETSPQFLAKFPSSGGTPIWTRSLAGDCNGRTAFALGPNDELVMLSCRHSNPSAPFWNLEAYSAASGASHWNVSLNEIAYENASLGAMTVTQQTGRARLVVGTHTQVGGRIVTKQINLDPSLLADGFE